LASVGALRLRVARVMSGDRAQIVFAELSEISAFIRDRCQ
jgi:hypothetical protein